MGLCQITDNATGCMSPDKVRWWTTTTSRSWRWHSQVAGVYSDYSTREMKWKSHYQRVMIEYRVVHCHFDHKASITIPSSSLRPSTSTDNALLRDSHSSSTDFSFALTFAYTSHRHSIKQQTKQQHSESAGLHQGQILDVIFYLAMLTYIQFTYLL